MANTVADKFGWSTDSFEVTTIGPDWGASVIQSSILAFVVSLVLIIAYISVRFRDYKMGITAVVALLHDLVIVFGVYALLGHEVTPNTIAAAHHLGLLALRHRGGVPPYQREHEVRFGEMHVYEHGEPFGRRDLIRSLNTSITSLIPVVAMLLFGGETLKDFALAMTIGLVTGAIVDRHRHAAVCDLENARAQIRQAAEEIRRRRAALLLQ